MDSVGDTLRRERLRQNLDLQLVARETKIGVRLLEAIESDQFDRLPGGVFAKSFVRQYARVLGLDEDELALRVERMIQPPPEPAATDEKAAAPREREIEVPRVPEWESAHRAHSTSALPALAMVVVVMLVCSAVYAWWQKSKQHKPEVASARQTLVTPAPQAQAAPPPAETPAAAPVETPAAPPTETPATKPAEQPTSEPQNPTAEAPTATSAAVPAATPENGAPAQGDVKLVVTAAEDTWISARSEGKLVYAGVLKSNETKALTGVGELRVIVGNAGGVNMTLNGKPVPSLGSKGQVRVVQFSPGGVQIVPRNPPPSVEPDPL